LPQTFPHYFLHSPRAGSNRKNEMATVAKLVEVLSQFLMVPVAEVQHTARRLREGGMLPADGTGRGAPHVDAGDCARLLIALLAADTATGAPQAVRDVDQEGSAVHGVFQKKDILVAPAGTFVHGIAFIIEHLVNPDTQGRWYNMVQRVGVRRTGDSNPLGWVETSGRGRTDYGSNIRLRGFRDLLTKGVVSVAPDGRMHVRSSKESILPGLTREASVGVRELIGLAWLLEGGSSQ
jgi:hypothetical protein